jgi:hypothetical protein
MAESRARVEAAVVSAVAAVATTTRVDVDSAEGEDGNQSQARQHRAGDYTDKPGMARKTGTVVAAEHEPGGLF